MDSVIIEVLDNYGVWRHLAERIPFPIRADRFREYTVCTGTSSWTIETWKMDLAMGVVHSQNLTPEDMQELPPCPRCAKRYPGHVWS